MIYLLIYQCVHTLGDLPSRAFTHPSLLRLATNRSPTSINVSKSQIFTLFPAFPNETITCLTRRACLTPRPVPSYVRKPQITSTATRRKQSNGAGVTSYLVGRKMMYIHWRPAWGPERGLWDRRGVRAQEKSFSALVPKSALDPCSGNRKERILA